MDFSIFFLICIIILAVLIFCCLIRAIRGPKIADRIMASNMIGTLTVAVILLLSVYIDESYIIDVGLVYAVISFLAVIVIAKIYIGLYRQHHNEQQTRNLDSFGSIYELRTEERMAKRQTPPKTATDKEQKPSRGTEKNGNTGNGPETEKDGNTGNGPETEEDRDIGNGTETGKDCDAGKGRADGRGQA